MCIVDGGLVAGVGQAQLSARAVWGAQIDDEYAHRQ